MSSYIENDALLTRIEVLEHELARVREDREADNIRWKQLIDAVTAERDRAIRRIEQMWRASHDAEDGQ